MLLKNSPWAAGVHSLSAVRPWGQGGREGEMERERESEKKRERWDRCKRERRNVENRVEYEWNAKRERNIFLLYIYIMVKK